MATSYRRVLPQVSGRRCRGRCDERDLILLMEVSTKPHFTALNGANLDDAAARARIGMGCRAATTKASSMEAVERTSRLVFRAQMAQGHGAATRTSRYPSEPIENHRRIRVRREDRVEDMRDPTVVDHEGYTLQQRHPIHLERGQA